MSGFRPDIGQHLERRYVEKFPGHAAAIRDVVQRLAHRHGREMFGARAYERIRQVSAQSSLKLLAQFSRMSWE